MNLKENKGITGVDISIALVIVVLFVGLIATLTYNFSTTSQGVNRKSDAINIAIQKIEQLKAMSYDDLISGTTTENKDKDGQTVAKGPYTVKTTITKYAESDFTQNLSTEEKAKLSDVIKIVEVNVSYTVQGEQKDVEISTVVSKEV